MKKHSYFFIYLCFIVLITTSQSCIHITPPPEADSCSHRGITYKIDGTLYSFDDENVTAEIRHDAAIGKFYDIWSDDNVNGQNGFYFHSTVTETGEQAPYAPDWFTTDDVGNIAFLNQKNRRTNHIQGHQRSQCSRTTRGNRFFRNIRRERNNPPHHRRENLHRYRYGRLKVAERNLGNRTKSCPASEKNQQLKQML